MSTLAELRTRIRIEARTKGIDNLDTWIDSLINEQTLQYVQRGLIRAMLVEAEAITLANADGIYDLPSDYLKTLRVMYGVGTVLWQLSERKGLISPARIYPKPETYEIFTSDQIKLFPSAGVLSTDTLMLDYYKRPTKLVADADEYPAIDLEPSLIVDVVARVRQFHDSNEAAAMKQQQAAGAQADAEMVQT